MPTHFLAVYFAEVQFLYPPSERSETGRYTVLTSCVSVCLPSMCTQYLDTNILKMVWDRELVPITHCWNHGWRHRPSKVKVMITISLRPIISKMARDRDSVVIGHHLPPQPYIKAVKNSLGRYMHSLSAFYIVAALFDFIFHAWTALYLMTNSRIFHTNIYLLTFSTFSDCTAVKIRWKWQS